MTVDVGDTLPDLSLPTDGGGEMALTDLKGSKTVLYFYPKDDTPGCTKEAQGFRDAKEDFAALGCRVIGVSADPVSKHDKFKDKHELNFTLLADTDKQLAQAMGVWVEKSMYGRKYMGMERSTFLLDASGVIRRVWRKVKVTGHVAQVLEAARQI